MGHSGQVLVWITLTLGWLVSAQEPETQPIQSFDFGWSPYNDTLTQCGKIDLTWQTQYPVSPPVGPYSVILYRAGQTPYRLDAGTGPVYPWHVNLNTGGPYLLTMEDARGAHGLVSDAFQVSPGSLSCPSSEETPQTLSLHVLTPSAVACDVFSLSINKGSPPYTLTVIPAARKLERMVFSSERFDFVLDVPAGGSVMFAVEDAAGRGAVSKMFTVQPGPYFSCPKTVLALAPRSDTAPPDNTTSTSDGVTSDGPQPGSSSKETHKTSNILIPAIVGSIIGGFALIGFVTLLVVYWRRRKRGYFEEPHDVREAKIAVTNSRNPSLNPPSQQPSITRSRRSPVSRPPSSSHPSRPDAPNLGGGNLGIGFDNDDGPVASSSRTPPHLLPSSEKRRSAASAGPSWIPPPSNV